MRYIKNYQNMMTWSIFIVLLRIEKLKSIWELHTSTCIISNPNLIADEFCNYFSMLFNNTGVGSSIPHDLQVGMALSPTHVSDLESCITNQEITKVFHDFNENKIPRLDGFNSNIFIHIWDINVEKFLCCASFH